MEIFINNQPVDFKPQFPLTWGKLYENLLQKHILPDHGIVRIVVDGQDAYATMTDGAAQSVPAETRVLELHTKDLLSITKDGFLKAGTLIEAIKADLDRTAALFRNGDIEGGSHKMINVMEAIKPLVNFINSIGMSYSLDFDQIRYDDQHSLRQKIEAFIRSLQDVIHAQEKKDFVELADYLEYQLKGEMSTWTRICQQLLEEIDRRNSPAN